MNIWIDSNIRYMCSVCGFEGVHSTVYTEQANGELLMFAIDAVPYVRTPIIVFTCPLS